jgi:hypothetical protein
MMTFHKLWTWVRDRFQRDADGYPVDTHTLDARRRRDVNRVQDETLARVTFGLG